MRRYTRPREFFYGDGRDGLIVGLLTYLLSTTVLGLGNTIGYHRLLTHRSFVCSPWVRGFWVILGCMHSGSPLMWVGLHRLHHAKSDSSEDPHTPTKGFWYAHSGWIIGTHHPLFSMLFAVSGFGTQGAFLVHDVRRILGKNPPEWRSMCPDLIQSPLLRALDVPLVIPALFVVQCVSLWFVGGSWGLLWLWAVHLSLTNGSWAVNSVCHWPGFGREDHPNRDDSRNVPWLSVFTFGESWHNNHHRYPRSAWHSLGGGADLSWMVIRLMQRVGLAESVWLPKRYRTEAR